MIVVILAQIVVLVLANPTVLARSSLQTRLITPGYSISLSTYHSAYHPSMAGPRTFWIWNNQGKASFPGRTLTFETLFYAECASPA